MKKIPSVGSRIQVLRGNARKTSGGLTKADLMMNKNGRVVSRSKHNSAKKEMRLLKYGYATKKGKFGFVKVGSKKRNGSKKRKGSRKMRGGGGGMYSLSPAGISLPEGGNADVTNGGAGEVSWQGHGSSAWSGDSGPAGGQAGGKSRRKYRKSRR